MWIILSGNFFVTDITLKTKFFDSFLNISLLKFEKYTTFAQIL